MTPEFTINLFSQLGWSNFDYEKTSKQVYTIWAKDVTTMGKKKMIEMGFCAPVDAPVCKLCR